MVLILASLQKPVVFLRSTLSVGVGEYCRFRFPNRSSPNPAYSMVDAVDFQDSWFSEASEVRDNKYACVKEEMKQASTWSGYSTGVHFLL